MRGGEALVIEKRTNGRWRVRVYRDGRYLASATFARRSDAAAWERQQSDLASVPARAAASRVSYWIKLWRDSRRVKPTTGHRYDQLIAHRVAPQWGHRPVGSVRFSEVTTWANELARVRSASTARQALLILRGALDLAHRDTVIAANPAAGVRLPTTPPNAPRALNHEEVWRLADAMPGVRDRLMVLVGSTVGLRWSELSGVHVGDVAEDGSSIEVRRAVTEVRGRQVVGTPKTHRSRTVHLPSTVARELELWLNTNSRAADAYLFATSTATPLRNRNWTKQILHPACDRARIERITPHHLRDTAASLLISSGASVVTVARMLGHQTAATTLRHYATFFPNELRDAANALERASEKARNCQPGTRLEP